MRKQDAPQAGWYPDPEGGARLRYWEGFDWSDRYRAPPVAKVTPPEAYKSYEEYSSYEGSSSDAAVGELADAASRYVGRPASIISGTDSQEMITQIREAARQEAERAAKLFGDQARSTVSDVVPLVTEYANKATRWLRRFLIVALVLTVAYFIFQIYAQASLFDWIGDRIDNLTNDDQSSLTSRGLYGWDHDRTT